MGITIMPECLFQKKQKQADKGPATIGKIAETGKYYRHPDSAQISYPLVVEKPLGEINQPLKIGIIGGGIAGIAALYELSNLANSSKHIQVTIFECDHEHFIHKPKRSEKTQALKAGRVTAALTGGPGHAAYEIGAMRFPEIAGLMWHYAKILYGADKVVEAFPNPGTVPTEVVHGNRVERFGGGKWLDPSSPTKKVVDIIKCGLFGQSEGPNTSFFQIGGEDPAKISAKLKNKQTKPKDLEEIDKQWKIFADKYDEYTLESAIREIIQKSVEKLPDIAGLRNDTEKVNYFVELFGTVGFGTGGFKSIYNMCILETMRLLLWDYSVEYGLPENMNVHFIKKLYKEAVKKNPNVEVVRARVCDVANLEENAEGEALVVYFDLPEDGTEDTKAKPKIKIFDYVILATTPRQTSSMISRIGFDNHPLKVALGDFGFGSRLFPENYQGNVRPALVVSNKYDVANSKLYTAVNHIHMASSSKIFATIKKRDFEQYAPDFLDQGKIRAVVSDCGLGSSYVVANTKLSDEDEKETKPDDSYSILISYTWEDDAKRLQHHFGKYPMNKDDTKLMLNTVINHTVRYVKDPVENKFKPWWFGEALGSATLEDVVSYDWTTFRSSGGFKLDCTGDYYNSHLIFRYHTHALKPSLKNKFFLANCSYSHLGGWIEGALMSSVNAVCGLIVAANKGNVNALNPEARKVLQTLECVVADNE